MRSFGLIDDSLVVWASNEPRGQHGPDEQGRDDRMYALVGSLGGTYRTGRVVDVGVDGYLPPDRRWDYHPPLLLNVARAYGYTGATFGEPYRQQGGPTPGLTVAG